MTTLAIEGEAHFVVTNLGTLQLLLTLQPGWISEVQNRVFPKPYKPNPENMEISLHISSQGTTSVIRIDDKPLERIICHDGSYRQGKSIYLEGMYDTPITQVDRKGKLKASGKSLVEVVDLCDTDSDDDSMEMDMDDTKRLPPPPPAVLPSGTDENGILKGPPLERISMTPQDMEKLDKLVIPIPARIPPAKSEPAKASAASTERQENSAPDANSTLTATNTQTANGGRPIKAISIKEKRLPQSSSPASTEKNRPVGKSSWIAQSKASSTKPPSTSTHASLPVPPASQATRVQDQKTPSTSISTSSGQRTNSSTEPRTTTTASLEPPLPETSKPISPTTHTAARHTSLQTILKPVELTRKIFVSQSVSSSDITKRKPIGFSIIAVEGSQSTAVSSTPPSTAPWSRSAGSVDHGLSARDKTLAAWDSARSSQTSQSIQLGKEGSADHSRRSAVAQAQIKSSPEPSSAKSPGTHSPNHTTDNLPARSTTTGSQPKERSVSAMPSDPVPVVHSASMPTPKTSKLFESPGPTKIEVATKTTTKASTDGSTPTSRNPSLPAASTVSSRPPLPAGAPSTKRPLPTSGETPAAKRPASGSPAGVISNHLASSSSASQTAWADKSETFICHWPERCKSCDDCRVDRPLLIAADFVVDNTQDKGYIDKCLRPALIRFRDKCPCFAHCLRAIPCDLDDRDSIIELARLIRPFYVRRNVAPISGGTLLGVLRGWKRTTPDSKAPASTGVDCRTAPPTASSITSTGTPLKTGSNIATTNNASSSSITARSTSTASTTTHQETTNTASPFHLDPDPRSRKS